MVPEAKTRDHKEVLTDEEKRIKELELYKESIELMIRLLEDAKHRDELKKELENAKKLSGEYFNYKPLVDTPITI